MRRFLAALLLLPLCWPVWAQTASDYAEQVQKMYIAYYGRPGDQGGIDYWAGRLEQVGGDLSEIIDAFGNSTEFQDRFGDFDNESLVENIYLQLLGRSADPEGLAFYTDSLATGSRTLGSIALDIANGAQAGTDDYQLIQNKLQVANDFSAAVAQSNLLYSLDEIVYARQILDLVSADASSLDAAAQLLESSLDLFPSLEPIRVRFTLADGDIVLEMLSREAPITVTNFLSYVDSGAYDGTLIHRVEAGFVIQGGGYLGREANYARIPTAAPIVNEASNGLSNERGTVAMARTSEPNSATSEWFINLADNDFLDYSSSSAGYAVFARVVEGMDLVDEIATLPTRQSGSIRVPIEDLPVQTVRRAD